MSIFQAIFSNNENKKLTFVLGAVLVVILILGLITYIFFYNDNTDYDNLDFTTNDIPAIQNLATTQSPPEVASPNTQVSNPTIESTQESTQVVQNPTQDSIATPQTSTINTISQLQYTIKPINQNIVTCHTMRNGRWVMPESCAKDIVESVQNLINTNKELIALEVSGIVDNNPYAGPSAELKQEGLASFRAREAIGLVTRNFSNVAVFEGLSIQAPDKRGFEIKAYYLQK
ncbi:hypothetical protein CCY99_01850 [Helicobacter sp. 16-1353]|uniref:hypothetical protein n=1 Tax=Helicobacter sp. 16-1353 TaxID=2004996 RepID=UPI000DCD8BCF|nr:hypothetical protein [Helicobacter sp. 16-1353]RAX54910.1 hypothetical protein CCY99_01850 [Helicobacter sp. 16-1353]